MTTKSFSPEPFAAAAIYFIYHCSRSQRELETLRALLRRVWARRGGGLGELSLGVPEQPNVLSIDGRSLRVLVGQDSGVVSGKTDKPGIDIEVLRYFLWRAELVKVVLVIPGLEGIALGLPDGRPMDLVKGMLWSHRTEESPEDHFTSPDTYRAGLERALSTIRADPSIVHRRFFSDLDRQTAEELIPSLPFNGQVKRLMKLDAFHVRDLLLDTLLRRSRGNPAFPPINRSIEELERVAVRLRTLVQTVYSGDHSRLYEGLERFAGGRLRVTFDGVVTCQPNSSYFFIFGELALAICRAILDGKSIEWTWTEALAFANATVRGQRLYVQAYGSYAEALRKGGTPPSLPHYRSFDYVASDELAFEKERLALRGRFSDATYDDLCARSVHHAREAFPGWVFAAH